MSEPDRLFCRPGDDEAVMDLQGSSLGCEARRIAAIDDGGILRIRGGDLRAANARRACGSDARVPRRPTATGG